MVSTSYLASQPVTDFLSNVGFARRQAHKALTLWPLVSPLGAPPFRRPAYIPLADALAAGTLVIDEVGEHGSVPHVRVTNRGECAVLVLFGEELRGAKQNRIANASFLIGAKQDAVIDVSCVEQGRWSRRAGAQFEAGDGVVSSRLRQQLHEHVAASRAAGHGFCSDQGEVWREVGERIVFSLAAAPTGAYADYYGTRSGDVEDICTAFRPLPGQVGFVAAIADEIVGLEAIGRPEVFLRVFDRLLRAYAIDAVDAAQLRQSQSPRRATRYYAPEPFIEALAAARAVSAPSLGLGLDLRIAGVGVSGCALAAEDLVHLTAFAD